MNASEIKALQKDDSVSKATNKLLKSRVEELENRRNYHYFIQGKTYELPAFMSKPVVNLGSRHPNLFRSSWKKSLQFPSPVASAQTRTVVVNFEKFGDREAVRRNARKLKGTGVFVNEDICAASQELIRNQFLRLRQASLEGKIAFFKHTIRNRVNRHCWCLPFNSSRR